MTQLTLELPHRPALGREDFLIAGCNAAAAAWLDRPSDWPAGLFVIHGPGGSGKTHLLQVWRAQSDAHALSAEDLAGAPGTVEPNACLAIDDVDGLVGDPLHEESLFHLLNAVKAADGKLLMTGRTAPARWPAGLPDLASRLKAAGTAELGAPDDALMQGLLLKLFADRQLRVTPEVLTYIGPRMERSFAAARTLVAELDAAALQDKREITVPLARGVLRRIEQQQELGE